MSHVLVINIDRRFGVEYTFICLDDRARCHLTCLEGCEEWSWDDHDHEFTLTDECNLCVFINEDESEIYEKYEGLRCTFQPGPVILTYQGDGQVLWKYDESKEEER